MGFKILFCGSPEFCIPSLTALTQISGIDSLHILSQPDKIRKRGNIIQPTVVKQFALDHNYPVITPDSKKSFKESVTLINPDLIIVIAYGMIIPKDITDQYICVNSHASLLPAYRGASPIQAALLNRESKTGVTLIHMNQKMDEGPIIQMESLQIKETESFQQLHDRLSHLAADCLTRFVTTFIQKKSFESTTQNHKKATYCKKIKKEDLYLNPQDPLEKNNAKIRAYSPKPGAYTLCNHKRLKILKATIKNKTLIPEIVQPEGKKAMAFDDFMRGNNHPIELC